MPKPSVKGSIFQSYLEALRDLREEGRLSADELAARLTPDDLALLDSEISPARWYPLETYRRIAELLGDLEGGDRTEYFCARGAANARRLLDAGLYQQLTFLDRWDRTGATSQTDTAEIVAAYKKKLRLVISLAGSIYNVGTWVVEPEPDFPGRVQIEIRDASEYSEAMRYLIEGFLNECARYRLPHLATLYSSSRVTPGLIVYRMSRDITRLTDPA